VKQLLQDLNHGKTLIVEAPSPQVTANTLIIESTVSLISAGTERMLVDFSRANLIEKARQQPERVKAVLDKVYVDGLLTTMDAVKSKLNLPIPLGYSTVGRVSAAGCRASGFKAGDRVVSNGPHADVVRVPSLLCAKIPENVSDEAASFAIVGAIGLQGIRLAEITLGESVAVIGTGLIGLLVVQILRAHGCKVIAVDTDQDRLELAAKYGAEICNPAQGEDLTQAAARFSKGRGVDAVLITASTKSSEIINQAARISRKRGRIILIGVTGLDLNRSEFYEKEITFRVSCSYGPGRYDSSYEENGNDYPIGFVRWTAQRNFEAILDLMSAGQIDVSSLVSHRFDFNSAANAYDLLSTDSRAIGILLKYDTPSVERHARLIQISSNKNLNSNEPKVGFIGAGNYASRVLIPAFKSSGAHLISIVSTGGTAAVVQAKKAGFSKCGSSVDDILADESVDTLVIATRHDTHAEFVERGLRSGKNVFVEKPLALTFDQISQVETAYNQAKELNPSLRLMVGFNRRFAPQIVKMKELISKVSGPKTLTFLMNAGELPPNHWTHDLARGGGRIIGEACHLIDLARFLVGAPIVSSFARRIEDDSGAQITEDKAAITLGFADGSLATIHYFANGASNFPKERVEVFAAGGILQLSNYRTFVGYSWRGFSKMNLWRQDKGQQNCAKSFLESIRSGRESPIPVDEIFEVARASIHAAEMLRNQ
jgi:predicted dehydrogenase